MAKYSVPTPDKVQEVLLKIPTLQLRRVFYDGLENPNWVRPLLEAGAFANPPEPVRTDDGYIRDPYWPEISYLVRVAPAVPSDVVEVLLALRASTNPWLRQAVFEIGSKIPASEGTRLKPLLEAWIPTGFGWRTDPRSQVSFAVALLEGGESKDGRWLANILFEPRTQTEAGNSHARTFLLEDFWYEAELPRICAALGHDALKAMSGWLAKFVGFSGHASGEYDFSGMDRPSIRVRDDKHPNPEDALVDAIRDTAVAAIQTGRSGVVDVLLRPGVALLRKIALFVVAEVMRIRLEVGDDATDLLTAAQRLLSDPKSDDEHLRIEYAELAQATARIDREVLVVIRPFLDLAYANDLTWMRQRLIADEDLSDTTELEIQARAQRYRHIWLSAIGDDALPPVLQLELARLNASNGTIDAPLIPVGRVTSWSGPNPHTSQQQMSGMSPSELVGHLASWHDTGDGWGPEPSHEGQGRELQSLLTTNPLALSGVSDLSEKFRPTYLRAILHGWQAALKADLELDWGQARDLIEKVLKHDLESPFPVEGDAFDDDKNYRGAKSAANGLLEELMKHRGSIVVPRESEMQFAQMLIEDCEDETAWAEYDEYTPSDDGWDPLNMSLNWQWPSRIRALIFAATRSEDGPWQQNALVALEGELARRDRHGAGRAALGEGLGRLHNGAPKWLALHIVDFVGSESGITVDQQIVLTTAMATHNYHRVLFEMLAPAMAAAIESREPLVSGWRDNADPLKRIGEWIIDAVIFGHKGYEDPIVQKFFTAASADVRGEAMSSVSWQFFRAESVEDAIRDRFAQLWDARIQHVQGNHGDSQELIGFYWLAKSAYFSPDWWLPRLHEALEIEPKIALERYMIGKDLAQASVLNPHEALAVLKLLLDGRADGGMASFDLSRNAIPIVIASAIRSGDEALMRDAETFMNILGASGHLSLESEVDAVLQDRVTINDVDE